MNEALFIVSILAIILSVVALIIGCISIAMISGFLRSTHTIQWKTLENPYPDMSLDPMSEEVSGDIPNPLKRKKKAEKEDYAFMEEVSEQSNF